MIKFHPGPEQLLLFAEGTLSPAESVMVSAHCDLCSQCRYRVAEQTAALADKLFYHHNYAQPMDFTFDAMLAAITQLPSSQRNTNSTPTSTMCIELDGKRFPLPRTLKQFAAKTGNWSKLVGKLWQAPVEVESSVVASFIYMEKGGGVPEHTHRGNEFTLVLDGAFGDGLNSYDTGDFIVMNDEQTHAPYSDAAEGCLVFSIVDQPLHFTSGIARWLNPFSHLFFR